jgi:hypothetical protein
MVMVVALQLYRIIGAVRQKMMLITSSLDHNAMQILKRFSFAEAHAYIVRKMVIG